MSKLLLTLMKAIMLVIVITNNTEYDNHDNGNLNKKECKTMTCLRVCKKKIKI